MGWFQACRSEQFGEIDPEGTEGKVWTKSNEEAAAIPRRVSPAPIIEKRTIRRARPGVLIRHRGVETPIAYIRVPNQHETIDQQVVDFLRSGFDRRGLSL